MLHRYLAGLVLVLLSIQVPSQAGLFSGWGKYVDSLFASLDIDKYKRTLDMHEGATLGHTISRHVNINMDQLRDRCVDDYGYWGSVDDRFRGKYVSKGSASLTLLVMLNNKNNARAIRDFEAINASGARKNTRYHIFGDVKYVMNYNRWDKNAINCNQNVFRKTTSFGWWTWHKDEVRLDDRAIAVIMFNKGQKRWFVRTSYPTR
jgi:hypothetical protein